MKEALKGALSQCEVKSQRYLGLELVLYSCLSEHDERIPSVIILSVQIIQILFLPKEI